MFFFLCFIYCFLSIISYGKIFSLLICFGILCVCICMTISFPNLGNFPALILLVFYSLACFYKYVQDSYKPNLFFRQCFSAQQSWLSCGTYSVAWHETSEISCLYLPSTEIKGTWLNPIFLYYICIFLFFLFSYYSDLVILSSNQDPLSSP